MGLHLESASADVERKMSDKEIYSSLQSLDTEYKEHATDNDLSQFVEVLFNSDFYLSIALKSSNVKKASLPLRNQIPETKLFTCKNRQPALRMK